MVGQGLSILDTLKKATTGLAITSNGTAPATPAASARPRPPHSHSEGKLHKPWTEPAVSPCSG